MLLPSLRRLSVPVDAAAEKRCHAAPAQPVRSSAYPTVVPPKPAPGLVAARLPLHAELKELNKHVAEIGEAESIVADIEADVKLTEDWTKTQLLLFLDGSFGVNVNLSADNSDN